MKIELAYPICLALLFTIVVIFMSNTSEREWDHSSHAVEYGDTLWEICKLYCPEDMDIWEYINLVKEINKLEDSTIRAGEWITILEERHEN